MKIAPVAEIKARLSAYLKACEDEPVIITRNGKPAAVLLAVGEENDLERLMLAYSPTFRAVVDAARQQVQKTGSMRHEALWQEIENVRQAVQESAKPVAKKGKYP